MLLQDNFKEIVVHSDKRVLIDFYADWCGPCKVMSPVVDRMAEKDQVIGVTPESVLEKKIQKML
ncbi:thioredoxin family protein [Megasphaera sp. WILCCON 0056]|uniref:thioredoxin family protein n=1 Tax=Megasphaera sp. WILCCON 0056 TaxID=3345340 RepID=UPI003A7FD8E0